jgi:hypothetical protein
MESYIKCKKPGNSIIFCITLSILLIIVQMADISCKKLVVVNPPLTSLTVTNVYQNDATAIAVLTGIYTTLSEGIFATGVKSISFDCGLSADELQGNSESLGTPFLPFYENALTNQNNLTFWENFYGYMYTVNEALAGVTNSTSLTPAVKQQLQGECKFLRAFIYFYLVNLYGDVPLVITNDYQSNSSLSRAPMSQVYHQIISDLIDAQILLSSNFVDGTLLNSTSERVRPNKWAATTLLARTYLYTQNWDSAEIEATEVINNSSLFSLDTLNGVFLKNSTEAIWQLQPVNSNQNTMDGYYFILTSPPSDPYNNPVFLSVNLVNAFEKNDNRMVDWINSYTSDSITYYYYPFKYKVKTSGTLSEYLMVLRLAELYLVRSEAEVEQNELIDAKNDLNIIRIRAGLDSTTSVSKADLLTSILHERQVELFTEWGHRWMDLIRTGNVNSVMGPPGNVCVSKGGSWSSNWQLYPIPINDLQTDVNLSQNVGY